jgi:hypothetical protein
MKRTAKLTVFCACIALLVLIVGDGQTQQTPSQNPAEGVAYLAPCVEPVDPGIVATLNTGCDGNGCTPSVAGCTPTRDRVRDLCCVDLDNDRRYHCAECIRYEYECVCGGRRVVKIGPYSDCPVTTRQPCTTQ